MRMTSLLTSPPGTARQGMPHLCSLLLKLLDGSLIDATTLVYEVPSGGRFARVHMSYDNDIDMGLLFAHGVGLQSHYWTKEWGKVRLNCLRTAPSSIPLHSTAPNPELEIWQGFSSYKVK